MKARKQKVQRGAGWRHPAVASWKEWGAFLAAGLVGCVGIGHAYIHFQQRQAEERREAQRLAHWREVVRTREKALRRMESDKGHEIEIRKRGGLRPGERLLSLPADSDDPPPSSARSGQ